MIYIMEGSRIAILTLFLVCTPVIWMCRNYVAYVPISTLPTYDWWYTNDILGHNVGNMEIIAIKMLSTIGDGTGSTIK